MDTVIKNKIIHVLISCNRGPNKHSLTNLSDEFIKAGLDFKRDILDSMDEVYIEFLSEKTDTAIKLGVVIPTERKIVMEILALVDPSMYQADKGAYLVSLNNMLKKYRVKYKLSVGLLDQLPKFAQRAVSIQTGINNIKLLSKKMMTDVVYSFAPKYSKFTKEVISAKVNQFDKTLSDISASISDPQKMYLIASKILEQNGYPEIAVRDKDPGVLSNSIFYEMVAASGVLKSLEDKEKTGLASNIYDNIALELVRLLK